MFFYLGYSTTKPWATQRSEPTFQHTKPMTQSPSQLAGMQPTTANTRKHKAGHKLAGRDSRTVIIYHLQAGESVAWRQEEEERRKANQCLPSCSFVRDETQWKERHGLSHTPVEDNKGMALVLHANPLASLRETCRTSNTTAGSIRTRLQTRSSKNRFFYSIIIPQKWKNYCRRLVKQECLVCTCSEGLWGAKTTRRLCRM